MAETLGPALMLRTLALMENYEREADFNALFASYSNEDFSCDILALTNMCCTLLDSIARHHHVSSEYMLVRLRGMALERLANAT